MKQQIKFAVCSSIHTCSNLALFQHGKWTVYETRLILAFPFSLVVMCLSLCTAFQLVLVLGTQILQQWWQTFWKEQERLAEDSVGIYLSKCEVKLDLTMNDDH